METSEDTTTSRGTDARPPAAQRDQSARRMIAQDGGYVLYRGAHQDQGEAPVRLYRQGMNPDGQSPPAPARRRYRTVSSSSGPAGRASRSASKEPKGTDERAFTSFSTRRAPAR